MPFHKHPSAVPVDPAVRNPVIMRTGRPFPSSRDPDVSAPVPAVIARDPDETRPWGHGPCFHNRTWRLNPDYNLLAEGANRQ